MNPLRNEPKSLPKAAQGSQISSTWIRPADSVRSAWTPAAMKKISSRFLPADAGPTRVALRSVSRGAHQCHLGWPAGPFGGFRPVPASRWKAMESSGRASADRRARAPRGFPCRLPSSSPPRRVPARRRSSKKTSSSRGRGLFCKGFPRSVAALREDPRYSFTIPPKGGLLASCPRSPLYEFRSLVWSKLSSVPSTGPVPEE
jgi:hypothetical protein